MFIEVYRGTKQRQRYGDICSEKYRRTVEYKFIPPHHTDFVCSQLYKRYVVFIEVYRGTKQRQRYGDNGITSIFFTVVKNIDEQWNISLFHRKA